MIVDVVLYHGTPIQYQQVRKVEYDGYVFIIFYSDNRSVQYAAWQLRDMRVTND